MRDATSAHDSSTVGDVIAEPMSGAPIEVPAADVDPLPLSGAGGPAGGPVAGEVLDAFNQPIPMDQIEHDK